MEEFNQRVQLTILAKAYMAKMTFKREYFSIH